MAGGIIPQSRWNEIRQIWLDEGVSQQRLCGFLFFDALRKKLFGFFQLAATAGG